MNLKQLRKANIEQLSSKNITAKNFNEEGIHPVFGPVTLSQLLATWTVHDLNILHKLLG
jgi:hypothetical protein